MTKKTTAIFLSVLVAVMPFLGFPMQFKMYFFLTTGLVLVVLIELISIQYCKRCGNLLNHDKDNLDKYEDIEVVEEGEYAEDNSEYDEDEDGGGDEYIDKK